MTCIVGLTDYNTVYIAGDSAGANSHTVTIHEDPKVFRKKNFLFGFTTSFRFGQILRYSLEPPEDNSEDPMAYLVSQFIPALRKTLADQGYTPTENGMVSGGQFLLGYRGSLFFIGENFMVGKPRNQLDAVGSGSEVALGSLHTSVGREPMDRLTKALTIASEITPYVRPPFVVERLEP